MYIESSETSEKVCFDLLQRYVRLYPGYGREEECESSPTTRPEGSYTYARALVVKSLKRCMFAASEKRHKMSAYSKKRRV